MGNQQRSSEQENVQRSSPCGSSIASDWRCEMGGIRKDEDMICTLRKRKGLTAKQLATGIEINSHKRRKMSLPKTSGIYAIKNKINNKCYIGQSTNICQRVSYHFAALRNGYHYNTEMQKDWITYGECNFCVFVLEECSQEMLEHKEMLYIEKYDSFNHGYNRTLGGIGPNGCNVSDCSRKRMRDNHADVRREKHPQALRIVLLNTREVFNCIRDAVEKYHVCSSDIRNNARRINRYAGKYDGQRLVWRSYEDYLEMSDEDIESALYEARTSRKGKKCHTAKSVKCINTGMVFETIQDAADYYNIGREAISSTCRHVQTYGGIDPKTNEKLKWEYY